MDYQLHRSRRIWLFAHGSNNLGLEQCGKVTPHQRVLEEEDAWTKAKGEIEVNGPPIEIESILSTRFKGRVIGTTTFGNHKAIIPEVEGRAWMTGRNEFWIDPEDPLKKGFVFR